MLWAASCALAIHKPSLEFGDPASFGFQPHDFAALASFNLGARWCLPAAAGHHGGAGASLRPAGQSCAARV